MKSSLSLLVEKLKRRHVIDLKIYRLAHCHPFNRFLHWILIPIECWSALLLCALIFPKSLTVLIGIALGALSLILSTNTIVGMATFLFHVASLVLIHQIQEMYCPMEAFGIATTAWTLAWALQVGVGHWMIEKNQPNVANVQNVSYLALVQSVLIAWSS